MSGPRVAFLETVDWGFATHRLHLGRAALAAGCEVWVVCSSGEASRQLRAEGFRIWPIQVDRGGTHPIREAQVVSEITRAYRALKPDLCHHVAVKPVLYGAIAARRARVPHVVSSFTGLGYAFTGSGLRRRLLREIIVRSLRRELRRAGGPIIVQNLDDQRLLERLHVVDAAKCVLIRGSGVDTQRFVPTPELVGAPVVLLASRMLWDKGIGETVAAARALRKRGLAFRLILAGALDPENPASIPEAQLRAWQHEGVADWSGHTSDMPRSLSEAHVACLPSYREGLPLFLLEAGASARPTLSTDVPGCREVVEHDVTGLLVPAKDAAALADALGRLLTDVELRRSLGCAGRKVAVREFSKERIIDQIFSIYDRLLGIRLSRPPASEPDETTEVARVHAD